MSADLAELAAALGAPHPRNYGRHAPRIGECSQPEPWLSYGSKWQE
jgi:hypothetical protein